MSESRFGVGTGIATFKKYSLGDSHSLEKDPQSKALTPELVKAV